MLFFAFVGLFFPLLLITWWCYIVFKYRKYLKRFPAVGLIPLLGINYHIRSTTMFYSKSLLLFRNLGRNFFTMLGLFPTLFTADPKMFALILGSPKHINKSPVYGVLKNAAGNSLLLVNGNEWRHQRKLLNPALDYANVKNNIHIFNAQSDDLIKTLAGETTKESTEIHSFIEHWSLLQTYETILGGDTDYESKIIFLEGAKRILNIAVLRTLRPNEYFNFTFVFTRNFWIERELLKTGYNYLKEVIKRKKIEIESGKIQRNRPILIDILLKQKETDEAITDDFMVRQLNLMIVAGFDTTAAAVCFTLYNLSIFPEVQQKAYEEIFSILGEDINQPITHQHVQNMKYLDLVIKESMRIKTAVPFYLRQLDEDVDFEGTILPKGLTVMFMPFAMHLDPDVYPDPEKFIPERFLPENMNPNRYSYAPFCGGVRNCIGQKYAMLALKVVLAKMLLNYELVDVKHELVLGCEVALASKTGVRVGIRKRRLVASCVCANNV